MHPVAPSTIVRGPAALAISFMTRADSHPWHVRWPEVKYSASGSLWTPLMGSSTCVAFVKVSVAMRVSLLPHAEPSGPERRLPGPGRLVAHVGRLVDVLERDLAPAEPADEGDQRGPPGRVVHGGADLVGHHAGAERRAERVVAVDDADGLRP